MTCSTLRVKDKLDCVMEISTQYVVVITNPHGDRRRRKMNVFRITDNAELLDLQVFGFVTAFLEKDFLLLREEKEYGEGRVRSVWNLSRRPPNKIGEIKEGRLRGSDVYDRFGKEILSGGRKFRIDQWGKPISLEHPNINYVVCFSDPLYIINDGSMMRLEGNLSNYVANLVGESFEISPDRKRIVSVAKGRQNHIRISVWNSEDGNRLHGEQHQLPGVCSSFGHDKPSFKLTEKFVLVAITRLSDEIPCLLAYDLNKLLVEGKPEPRCLELDQMGPLYEAPQLAVENNFATVAGKTKSENVVKHLNIELDF